MRWDEHDIHEIMKLFGGLGPQGFPNAQEWDLLQERLGRFEARTVLQAVKDVAASPELKNFPRRPGPFIKRCRELVEEKAEAKYEDDCDHCRGAKVVTVWYRRKEGVGKGQLYSTYRRCAWCAGDAVSRRYAKAERAQAEQWTFKRNWERELFFQLCK